MVTRVLSILGRPTAGTLDLNAYALAEDVDLTLVLAGAATEIAVAAPFAPDGPTGDLRALLASSVRVLALRDDLRARGLDPADLLPEVEVVEEDAVAGLVREHDVTLTWP